MTLLSIGLATVHVTTATRSSYVNDTAHALGGVSGVTSLFRCSAM